jgi:hypothetical protein
MSYIPRMILFCAVFAIIYCNIGQKPPLFPPAYTAEFDFYALDRHTPPPFTPNEEQRNYIAKGKGRTYYDDSSRNFRDEFDDFCIPILDKGEDWHIPCKFFNTPDGKFYTVKYVGKDKTEECCLWGDGLPPYRPNTLRAANAQYKGVYYFNNEQTEYYFVEEQPADYGFYSQKTLIGDQPYHVLAYFTNYLQVEDSYFNQKVFTKFELGVKDKSVFVVPEVCKKDNLPKCLTS